MLTRHRTLFNVVAAVLSLASGGCASLIGVTDADVDFKVVPRSDGGFFGWSEISIDQDVSSVNRATLLAVTLDTERPEGTPDMTYLLSIIGEAVAGEQRTLAVTGDKFPHGEQAVTLDVKYHDDLKLLFKDSHTFRIEWTGQTNPSFTDWPADGMWVRARIKIDVE